MGLRKAKTPSVAEAIEDHYKPQGPNDRIPTSPVSIAVALADKLDTLVGFWAIDEKPTGSKDPYALRRAALGVIRIVIENELRLPLTDLFSNAYVGTSVYPNDTASQSKIVDGYTFEEYGTLEHANMPVIRD